MKLKQKLSVGFFLFGAIAVVVLSSCAYGGVTTVGKDHVVVLRNDGFLFGALRKAYVCKATPGGLENCRNSETP